MPRVKVNCQKCGKELQVYPSVIKRGKGKFCSYSCRSTVTSVKHGLWKHPLHGVWTGMKQRCENPKSKYYHNYGGRGITVCEEWQASFVAFYEWATANGYAEGLELDREKNDEGYSPSNCRFVTHQKNQQNKRKYTGSSAQYKGVCWDSPRGKWHANYAHNGKKRHLGRFASEEDAARTWDREAIAQGRDRSCLNFPEESPTT